MACDTSARCVAGAGLTALQHAALRLAEQSGADGHVGWNTELFAQMFVLNLERRADRRQRVEAMLNRSGARDYTVFPATDTRGSARVQRLASRFYRSGDAKRDLPRLVRGEPASQLFRVPAGRGAAACYLTHLRLLRALRLTTNGTTTTTIASCATPAFLVFEDDAFLPPDFHARLFAALSVLPADWSMLYLGYNSLGRRSFACDAIAAAGACTCHPLCRVRGHILDSIAYAVHARALDELIAWLEDALARRGASGDTAGRTLPIDMELSRYIATHPTFAVYATMPSPIVRHPNRRVDSDIAK